MLLGGEVRELHHDGRTNGKYLVDVLLFDELLDADSNDTLLAVAAIVGHDDDLVAGLTHLVFKDNQILATAGHHAQHAVAFGLQCLNDGQHGCYAQSTASTHHRAIFFNARRIAQRTNHVSYVVALVEGTELLGREAHLLYYQCDGSALNVGSTDGQRHALALLVNAHDDKVAGLAALGNQRGLYLERENLLGELFLLYYLIHFFVLFSLEMY